MRAVAEAWGFDDPAHFSRRFARTYGVAPSEVAALRAAAGDDRAPARAGAHWRDADRLRRWLKHA